MHEPFLHASTVGTWVRVPGSLWLVVLLGTLLYIPLVCVPWVIDLEVPTGLEPRLPAGRFRTRILACGYSTENCWSSFSRQSHLPAPWRAFYNRPAEGRPEESRASSMPPETLRRLPQCRWGCFSFPETGWDCGEAALPHTEPSRTAWPVWAHPLPPPDSEGRGGPGSSGIKNLAPDLKSGSPGWNLTHRQ